IARKRSENSTKTKMARISGKQFDKQIRRRFRNRFGKAVDLPVGPTQLVQCRKDEIAELAEAVAGEHYPAGIVEPKRIARAKRITMSFGKYGDTFDGMLEHKAGRFHIFCNLDRAGEGDCPRARFTLAHELGHYFIDEHRNALAAGRAPAHRSQCDYESQNLAEQEADQFAANLLMPRWRFVDKAESAAPGLAGIISLAREFGTSLTATAIRYAAADISPCAVVKWNWGSYAWKWLSSSTFTARYRRTVEAPEKLPPDSPTARALARETPPECGYFEAGTTASAWFPRVKSGEFRDVIFIEQAIGLGRFGILTFLFPEGGKRTLRCCLA
ncbi:MAG: ImmA/IrrE family metallo-endopeptidase, partial [Planctomycetota bacterium]|nr:ImmA/IrrE family metallo-endopeptidase [Planctomycetota bacterium]